MKRIMMTMAVAAMGMTAMMAQSHEVTTTDKNGNKVVYEISDAAATKGDTLSITKFDPQSVAKSDSINRASREENYELTKEDIRSIMREMDIDTDWVPTALGGMILGGIICVVLPGIRPRVSASRTMLMNRIHHAILLALDFPIRHLNTAICS